MFGNYSNYLEYIPNHEDISDLLEHIIIKYI